MIVDGFPEPQPQVQYPQPAEQSADESVRDDGAEAWHRKQEWIVGPLGGPGQDDQQYPEGGAHRHKQERPDSQEPEVAPAHIAPPVSHRAFFPWLAGLF